MCHITVLKVVRPLYVEYRIVETDGVKIVSVKIESAWHTCDLIEWQDILKIGLRCRDNMYPFQVDMWWWGQMAHIPPSPMSYLWYSCHLYYYVYYYLLKILLVNVYYCHPLIHYNTHLSLPHPAHIYSTQYIYTHASVWTPMLINIILRNAPRFI